MKLIDRPTKSGYSCAVTETMTESETRSQERSAGGSSNDGASARTSESSNDKAKRRRTQAERTATAHRKMIRAATRLIARQGYTRTTLAQVGKEAGYTGGLVSHHFGSKEGLLMETVRNLASRFRTDQIEPATAELSGLDSLDTFIDLYLGELDLHPGRMKALYVLMGEAMGPVPEIQQVFADINRGMRRMIAGWIEQGVTSGEIRPEVDPDTAAVLVVAMIRGVTNQAITDPPAIDLSSLRASIKASLRQNLTSSEKA